MKTRRVEIWQSNPDKELGRKVAYSSYELISKFGIEPSKSFYDKVYEGTVEADENDTDALEYLFELLNIGQKPEGYEGHSLSVSDIVVLDGKSYYCDNFGFVSIEF